MITLVQPIGYKIKTNSDKNWREWTEIVKTNPLYFMYGSQTGSVALNTEGIWMPAPSVAGANWICSTSYDTSATGTIGGLLTVNRSSSNYGFRPVICLKSGVSLKEGTDGNYELYKK